MRRWVILLLLGGILAGTALLYRPTLAYEAIWDTRDFLRKSILLTRDRPLLDAFRGGYIYGQLGMDSQSMYYRPLVSLSFMLEKRMWGLSPRNLRRSNLALFLLLVALVFLLLRTWGEPPPVALAAAALFAASPVNPGNVVWIVGRGDLMMLLFSLLTLICLRKARSGNSGRLLTAAAWTAYALALLSKDTALFLIPLLPLADPPGTRWRQRRHHLGFLITAAGYLAVKHLVLGIGAPRILYSTHWLDYPLRGLQLAGHYAGILLLPFRTRLFHFISETATPWHLAGGALAVAAAAAACFHLRRRPDMEGLRLPAALAAWFVLPFILLGFTDLWPFRLSTRYMMVASVGVCWLLARGAERLPRLPRHLAVPALVLLYLPATIGFNRAHRSELVYWRQAEADHPGHPALIFKLAETHYVRGDDLIAAALLRRGSSIPARRLTARHWLLLQAKLEAGSYRYAAARRNLSAAGPLPPEMAYQSGLLDARMAAATGDGNRARAVLESLIRAAPARIEAYAELHRILVGREDWTTAERVARRARAAAGMGKTWDTAAMRRTFSGRTARERLWFYLNHWNPRAAADLLERLDAPDSLENRLFAAWVEYQAGRGTRAEAMVRKGAETYSTPADRARIGRFYLDHLRRPGPALSWYRRALAGENVPEWRATAARLDRLVAPRPAGEVDK